jgi:hypothetical protein
LRLGTASKENLPAAAVAIQESAADVPARCEQNCSGAG